MQRKLVGSAIALLVCAILTQALEPLVASASQEETVAFNTKSLKFHCLNCEWAVKCTVNCIEISRSEAITRGAYLARFAGEGASRGGLGTF